MRKFKIIVAIALAALCIGLTTAIYLQSPGAALAVGLLFLLVVISFLYDHRQAIFSQRAEVTIKLAEEKTALGVAQAAALTRLAEGEIRGTPNYSGS